jgi:dTDP-4-dehydrorhamnose reductase
LSPCGKLSVRRPDTVNQTSSTRPLPPEERTPSLQDLILLTGATGYLGRYLLDEIERRGIAVRTAGRVTGCDLRIDLAAPASIRAALAELRPRYVLNCGAMAAMSACQEQPKLAFQVNARAPVALARAAGCRFLQVSTDLVFGGDAGPYTVSDAGRPRSVYGMSKFAGERLEHHDAVVVRVPLLFGKSHDGRRGATDMLRAGVGAREKLTLFVDEFRTPLHAADAARGLVDLLLAESVRGIQHLAGPERVSRWEFAMRFCAAVGLPADAFQPGRSDDLRRPKDVSLIGDWQVGRGLDAALATC